MVKQRGRRRKLDVVDRVMEASLGKLETPVPFARLLDEAAKVAYLLGIDCEQFAASIEGMARASYERYERDGVPTDGGHCG